MADEAPAPAPAASGKRRLMPFAIVALLMGVEGVGVFFLAKIISPEPEPAMADGGDLAEDELGNAFAEVELAECRPSNMMAGRFVTFHIRVSGLVAHADKEHVEELVRANRARLEDGVNTVIRKANPKHLDEPELGTIRRQLKSRFDVIFEDDQLIKRVLIPQILQSGRGV